MSITFQIGEKIKTEPLTFEKMKECIDGLRKDFPFAGCELIESKILTSSQVVIKSGQKIYYSPDIKTGEIKIIDVTKAENPFQILPPDIKYDFNTTKNDVSNNI